MTRQAIEELGGRVITRAIDVADSASVNAMVEDASRTVGPIDLLVNNAGVSQALGYFHEVQPANWWHEIEVNLGGQINCIRAVLPAMIQRRSGTIVNVISASSFRPRAGQTAYCTSKSAVEAFTEHFAVEAREYGVKVFALSPGLVHTAILDDSLVHGTEEMRLRIKRNLDEGRTIPPERAAQVVIGLALGRADKLSGRFFDATEDFEALVGRADEIVERDLYVVRDRRS